MNIELYCYYKEQNGNVMLTQLGDLSVEGAADCPAVERQTGQAVVTHRVSAQQQPRDLVSL